MFEDEGFELDKNKLTKTDSFTVSRYLSSDKELSKNVDNSKREDTILRSDQSV